MKKLSWDGQGMAEPQSFLAQKIKAISSRTEYSSQTISNMDRWKQTKCNQTKTSWFKGLSRNWELHQKIWVQKQELEAHKVQDIIETKRVYNIWYKNLTWLTQVEKKREAKVPVRTLSRRSQKKKVEALRLAVKCVCKHKIALKVDFHSKKADLLSCSRKKRSYQWK